ncbi:hypothetical protein Pcinc_007875 [Petrolisthes cinctipes]|uniref:PHD-type domain-containing protein n=1 Tax=Petrolisthes cinctipes TaxID=88211 RepID=A0AAE1KW23_PETCI|nr:hypothetical protein Pcinc_025324 [Petrolisthes cinctipes]KAK3871363.1 hypothetical protein Pcinc_023495 [Petrolisthes cinctipes]KAK3874670.1 hypothetical protein Pcinc_020418 [Petrolisthes cinctipes]KAK3887646.1 hypothetical protein Pcinc_008253 [Petrolisthes cinctipes]KAK3888044.1 hypothetical protein Pcinc_007875 [Petrolisthes cinctipes]
MDARTRQGGKKKCRECNQFEDLDEDMRCTTCATPEDKLEECRTCKKKVREIDNGIKCDGCKTWNHIGCEKVGKNYYKALKEEDGATWFCKACKQTILSSFGELRKLRNDNKQMREELQKVTSNTENINERVNNIEDRLNKQDEDTVEKTTSKVLERIEQVEIVQKSVEVVLQRLEEKQQREKCKKNIVLYNVPESKQQRLQEKTDEDILKCRDLFENSLKVKQFKIERVLRLGRPREDERNRPILVQLRDENEKWSIINNARNMKYETDPEKKKIGISKDLTKEERDAEKRVREELREKRRNGEQGWYVKNGTLHRTQGTRNRY